MATQSTKNDRGNGQPPSSETVADLVREISTTGKLPASIAEDPLIFLRRVYDAWVNNGGLVAGKSRNSQRQITELLEQREVEVSSIQPKLAGNTRLTKNDIKSLIDLFLSHWNYIGPPKEIGAIPENYTTISQVNVQDVSDIIVNTLFSKRSSGVYLPPRSSKRSKAGLARDAREVVLEVFSEAHALITVSSERTIIASTSAEAVERFHRAIRNFWGIDQQDHRDRVLIWVVDIGSRRFDDHHAISAFSNAETLATAFRALAIFKDASAQNQWNWLEDRTAIVVGSLAPSEIDAWHQDEEGAVKDWRTKWPWISAEHIMLGALPIQWVRDPNLPKIFGLKLEELDKRSFTILLRDSHSDRDQIADEQSRLRYFAFGPNPKEVSKRRSQTRQQQLGFSSELASPDIAYDEAFQVLYSAACHRLQRNNPPEMAAAFPPLEALAHLRHLGFAVLRLNEFLSIKEKLHQKHEQ